MSPTASPTASPTSSPTQSPTQLPTTVAALECQNTIGERKDLRISQEYWWCSDLKKKGQCNAAYLIKGKTVRICQWTIKKGCWNDPVIEKQMQPFSPGCDSDRAAEMLEQCPKYSIAPTTAFSGKAFKSLPRGPECCNACSAPECCGFTTDKKYCRLYKKCSTSGRRLSTEAGSEASEDGIVGFVQEGEMPADPVELARLEMRATVTGDPHIRTPLGEKFDVRGFHRIIFNLHSSSKAVINVYFECFTYMLAPEDPRSVKVTSRPATTICDKC